ncbi:MAG: TlpA disulfide reductase family protein [Myxococcota bacterium]|nr:TlpA disulfide reductase family protein [Myxococcota bacterium]
MKRVIQCMWLALMLSTGTSCSSSSGDGADTGGTVANDGSSSTDSTAGGTATDGSDGSDGTDGNDGSLTCPAGFADGAGTTCEQGQALLDFTIKNCEGTDTVFSEQLCQAKCTLVYFGAGWCVPCRDKQPTLQKWHDTYGDAGFQVINILREDSGPSDLATTTFCQEWSEEYQLTFPVLIDPTDRITATCLGSQAFPVSLLVRDNWDVLYQDYSGETPDAEWEELIQECTAL